jgi:hypothetical protein
MAVQPLGSANEGIWWFRNRNLLVALLHKAPPITDGLVEVSPMEIVEAILLKGPVVLGIFNLELAVGRNPVQSQCGSVPGSCFSCHCG